MSGRDNLAEMIRDTCWPTWKYPATPDTLADAIIEAGWRPVPALSFTEQEADRNAREAQEEFLDYQARDLNAAQVESLRSWDGCWGGLFGSPTECKCASCGPTGRVGGGGL